MIGRKPGRPADVTLETTVVTPIEMANFVNIIRKPSIAEDSSGLRTYLMMLQPGQYTLTGAAGMYGAIGSGNCFCMGTLGFILCPGQIVDAGTIRGSAKDYFASPTYTPATAQPAMVPQIPGRAIQPATMFATGKVANIGSKPVTRIGPVPGILAYDRDIPLDAAQGNRPIPAVR